MPKKIHLEVVRKMTSLATSALGLVSALAWNELIKNFIDTFIKPLVGTGSVLISQLIYAVIVTALAVIVTLQLSFLEEKFTRRIPG